MSSAVAAFRTHAFDPAFLSITSGKLAAAEGKLRGAVQKACAPPALAFTDLQLATGLGYGAETDACAQHGVASLASAADVADCVVAEHGCRAEDLAGSVGTDSSWCALSRPVAVRSTPASRTARG